MISSSRMRLPHRVSILCRNKSSTASIRTTPDYAEQIARMPLPAVTRRHFSQYWKDTRDPSEKLFNKILIANRGEIARRIIKTCRTLGIRTVAVHSDIDSNALFVHEADEAVCIGPAPTSESYLNMERVLNACMQTRAEAVHPGYGFLSENMSFAARLEQAGIKFIGPNSHAVNEMGDKIHSKQVANKAKVSTVPGYDGELKDAEECVKISREIGYPVMVKASAGGGGKGMRVCYNDKDAQNAFKLCAAEARSSFGDDRLLVEKYIEEPHHIEVQILGDKHGNAIYLNERECSVQRRNQKVIEEAPSPFADEDLRKRMGEQAVAMARAVGYDSAGTVEFLVDKHKQFYFLEMNTRLQVEHPITECITGVDLVYHMIRSAAGHKLKFQQSDIGIDGWAIEARVYAEDPYKSFGLPSIGRLSRYVEPENNKIWPSKRPSEGHVRCDSGIVEGSEISVYYDPLICKLITSGRDRNEALRLMRKALDEYVIRGVTHNIPLLRDIVTEDKFCAGNVTTAYLSQTYPEGFTGARLNANESRFTHVAAVCMHVLNSDSNLALSKSAFVGDFKHAGSMNLTRKLVDDDFIVYDTHNAVESKKTAFRVRLQHKRRPSERESRSVASEVDLFQVEVMPINCSNSSDRLKEILKSENFDERNVDEEAGEEKRDNTVQKLTLAVSADKTKPFLMQIMQDVEGRYSKDEKTHLSLSSTVQVLQRKLTGKIKLQYKGSPFAFQVYPTRYAQYLGWIQEEQKEDLSKILVSPMPGVVRNVTCKVGDKVSEGMELCVIEAMKMQNSLTAPVTGRVKAINCQVGETVDEEALLIELEA